MSAPGRARLEGVLQAEAPLGLVDAVSDAELERVAEAIAEVQDRQHQALGRAGEQALTVLPRVLRGPVRKIARGSR